MQLAPAVFWRLTLAEWRAMLEGFEQRQKAARYRDAWVASYQLIAAGCDAEKVSPAKLLGEEEAKPRRKRKAKRELSFAEFFERMPRCDAGGKLMPKGAVGDGKV